MSKVICMIPARYQSTRFQGKALAEIGGKPMVQHVYERCREAKWLDCVAVVTDNDAIFRAVRAFGGKVLMSSPLMKTGTDRIAQVADYLALADGDVVINVQGDQPRIRPEHLSLVMAPLVSFPSLPMSTLAFPLPADTDPSDRNTVKVAVNRDGYAIYFSRSPIPFHVNGNGGGYLKHLGIYAYRRGFLRDYAALPQGVLERVESLEQLRAIENGHSIRVVVTDIDSPSVDVPEDLRRIRTIEEKYGGCAG